MAGPICTIDDKTNMPPKEVFVEALGIALKKLSELHHKGKVKPGKGNFDCIDLSYSGNSDVEAQVSEVCEALAVAPLKKVGGKWELGPITGPKDCKNLKKNHPNIRIVFEEEDELVLSIPHWFNIEFGLQNPPMWESDYIVALCKDDIIAICDEIERKVLGLRDVSSNPGLSDKIRAVFDDVKQTRIPPRNDVKIFHQQLGSYTCRQCG